jgi:hypothetical protein
MQQSASSKHVPKLTECTKACLEEQNKDPKKQKNDKKGGEAAPKKARPDQWGGSDNTKSEADESFQATTPSIDTRPSTSVQSINEEGSDNVSTEGPEIIELSTSQSKVTSDKQTPRGNKGELKYKARCHQLTVELQCGGQSSTHPSMACLNSHALSR